MEWVLKASFRPLYPQEKDRVPIIRGYALAQLVKALCYNPDGREFDSRCNYWKFSLA
jgi:hypothetical protein